MRIIFLGTPEFAVASLDLLYRSGEEIAAVVTAPDKPAGRGQQLNMSAVKKYAMGHEIPVLQPVKLKDEGFLEQLRACQADLFIVVAFRMLPEEVWNMPRLGTYNLHGSLLPKYRGAAPINWAIINGEQFTGVTTFKLKHEIDSGNILMQEKISINEEDDAGTLHDRMMSTGAQLLLKTVRYLQECDENGRQPEFREQENEKVTHAPKIFRETCRISWNDKAVKVHDLVRGLSPYPAAFTTISSDAGKHIMLKIFKTRAVNEPKEGHNGSLLTDGSSFLRVKAADGWLEIEELQMEGKRRMDICSFLRGFKFDEGAFFE